MIRRWQVIDDDGTRDVFVDADTGSIRSGMKAPIGDSEGWPSFTQFAVRAPLGRVSTALRGVAGDFERRFREIEPERSGGRHAVLAANFGDLTVLTEPGVRFESRFITASSSEALADVLEATGLHFGHDRRAGTLHLTRFEAGAPDFSWCDSLEPGPSFALDFGRDGQCTQRDPRRFAVDRLGGPAGGQLDRSAFVRAELAELGLELLDPDFERVEPVAGYDVGVRSESSFDSR